MMLDAVARFSNIWLRYFVIACLNQMTRVELQVVCSSLPRKTASRVENTGRQWKQNCCKLLQVYVLFLF